MNRIIFLPTTSLISPIFGAALFSSIQHKITTTEAKEMKVVSRAIVRVGSIDALTHLGHYSTPLIVSSQNKDYTCDMDVSNL